MPSFTSIIVALAFISISFASPHPHQKLKRGFTVHQNIQKPRTSGPKQLQKAYHKYLVSKDIGPLHPNDPSSPGAANFPGPSDIEYSCTVLIGKEQLSLDFDTGSSDL